MRQLVWIVTYVPRCLGGVLADIVLGPAEDFDYVSTTSPPVTPPPQ